MTNVIHQWNIYPLMAWFLPRSTSTNGVKLTPSVFFISGPYLLVQNHLSVTKMGHNLASCLGFNYCVPSWVVLPTWRGVAMDIITPFLAVDKKLVFNSIVVKPFAWSFMFNLVPHAHTQPANVTTRSEWRNPFGAINLGLNLISPITSSFMTFVNSIPASSGENLYPRVALF